MAVKIRLKRLGKIRAPYYRIVVADSRTKRDGRVIEEIGKYHPTEEPSFIEVDSERAQYWLGVGAQPTEQVLAILKLTGDWGKFKGDKNAVSTVRTKDAKEVFAVDTAKKSVVKPKAEKPAKVEEPAEAPAEAEAEVAETTDEA
ncbi:30S ribosomal protein S16 [Agromyces protaetiae]|uniref:Small ribosomal subunit protein bS16 n=1 Tax=Agromyces protaetiae TaxID=2509455 RepID=A0A4P6FCK8_9MICO|nr:30S ribosomal protein S16 [Agromyces protaetiae]QAY73792.1 30S ribosomal protein S16 [Agromyces protaetiae]